MSIVVTPESRSKVSPKRTLLLKVFGKASGSFRRSLGELSRVRVNANGAERELAKANQNMESTLKDVLGATGLPVVTSDAAIPEGAYWLVAPLVSQRNALYARNETCVAVAYIEKDGTCPIGAIMMPLEDICVIAEAGLGASAEGLGRLRCGNRVELADTLCMVPWKTKDVVHWNLLSKLDDAGVHTRKSGNTLMDIVDVACGKADFAIGMSLTRIEVMLANLIMAESAGFASDLQGKALGPTSTKFIISNPKLHAQIVRELELKS